MIKTRIKELREEKGLSQTKLAAELGLNQRTVSNYETGSLEPNIQTIKKLCEYFGVSADYLLGLEEF
ncbi:MAG: helix-turn-helix domain-containing protein [Firmicutes bacterium]|nr:helix-turn-helix domain-containing protein [Bacillota bacterium]